MMLPALLLAVSCALASAASGPPQKAFSLKYDQHDFANGLRLITVPTEYPNVVALYIVVQTGSRNEVEPGRSGFAHLFEHMMFRGTKAYPPDKYEAVLKQAGAASNAYTTDDHTAYHTTFSKEDLETILRIEADRFRNLDYSESVFRTEALAVLGEYNKNSASPTQKLNEVLRDTAFDRHTYKHTTMGFLKDVQDMPNMYEYSKTFFQRYYRPEYTTIIVAGDVNAPATRELVEKYWGGWERGSFRPDIPAEPPQKGPRTSHVDWPTPTLPWVEVAFRGSPYRDDAKDQAVLDIISFVGFSESSDLYQKLVIQEQMVDLFGASNPDRMDPYLFSVLARVKKASDIDSVREQILSALSSFKDNLVSTERLEAVKRHLRYQFALGMDNSQSIASVVAHYVALRRSPETINKVYDLYAEVTPEDVREIARKYFVEDARTIITLTGKESR